MNEAEAAGAAAVVAVVTADDTIFDFVAFYNITGGVYEVHAKRGAVAFQRVWQGDHYDYPVVWVRASNPIGDQDTTTARPTNGLHASLADVTYAHGYERVTSYFDHPRAGDMIVQKHPANDGSLGHHGSLETLASRGQLLVSGKGFTADGIVNRSAKGVDVAPTIAKLLDIPQLSGLYQGQPMDGLYLKWQDGKPLDDVLTGEVPDHVAGFLWDQGFPPIVMEMLANGQLPNVQALLDRGTFYEFGQTVNWPSNTMPGHTLIGTGTYSGHHGVIDNWYYERATGERLHSNTVGYWEVSDEFLSDEVETIFEAVERGYPGSYTAVINDIIYRGADFATVPVLGAYARVFEDSFARKPTQAFDYVQNVVVGSGVPDAAWLTALAFFHPECEFESLRHRFEAGEANPLGYGVEAAIDHIGVSYAAAQVPENALEAGLTQHPIPKLLFFNQLLTDGAGHEFGYDGACQRKAYIEADARIGAVMDRYRAAGVFDDTAFYLVSDHGQATSNPANTGSLATAIADAGIEAAVMGSYGVYLQAVAPTFTWTTNGGTATVTARVVNDDTGAVVAGATVSIGGATATTDDTGRATVTGVPAGQAVSVRVTAAGFNAFESTRSFA